MSDTLDVITLTEAKTALSIDTSDTAHDTALAAYITAVSRVFDKRFGPVVQRNVTESCDGGNYSIALRYYPVASITTVTEYSGGDATTLTLENPATTPPADGYLADLAVGIITRRAGGFSTRFAAGMQNIAVAAVAGRYASTATVDPRFKVAASMMLTQIWRRDNGAGTRTFGDLSYETTPFNVPTFAIPNAVLQMLADEIQGPVVA